MLTFHGLLFLAHFLAFSTKLIAGQDLDTFCNRLYHSCKSRLYCGPAKLCCDIFTSAANKPLAIIINDKLYVDGGELRVRNSSKTVKITLRKSR